MDEDKELTPKQKRVIPYLLAAPSMEQGCKQAGVSKAIVYEWLKNRTFHDELKRQRNAAIERGLDALKANLVKATATLVKLLDSKRENIRIRAAERIVEFTQKALEQEELERRIQALEETVMREAGDRRSRL